MKSQAINLLEFQKRFPDEKACLNHLFELRWSDGFICPRCGHKRHSFIQSRRLYQCRACRYQASLTAGTIFHNTRTPIRKWFWMIFMMTRQKSGVAILRMQELLDIGSYKTAWLMGHKIRKAMEDRDRFHTLGSLFEMDDTFVGGAGKAERHQKAGSDSRFVVRVEKGGDKQGYCSMRLVDDIDSECAVGLPTQEKKGVTDTRRNEKSACDKFQSRGPAHSSCPPKDVKSQSSGFGWVYAAIANVKGNLRGVHHGVSRKYLQRYLSEFCYRFNRRLRDRELFNMAVVACLRSGITTLAELTI